MASIPTSPIATSNISISNRVTYAQVVTLSNLVSAAVIVHAFLSQSDSVPVMSTTDPVRLLLSPVNHPRRHWGPLSFHIYRFMVITSQMIFRAIRLNSGKRDGATRLATLHLMVLKSSCELALSSAIFFGCN